MKRLLGILTVILTIGTSQASTSPSGIEESKKVIVSAIPRPIVTRNASGHVSILKVPKPKLFTGKPHNNFIFANDWEDDFLEIDDVITSYRRRDLNKIEHLEGLSEHVRWRLFLARQLALLKYKKLHS